MRIGEHLRELRLERGWSQDELGEKIQIDGRQISRYENGHVKPTAKVLRRFAKAFEVTLKDLEDLAKAPSEAAAEFGFQDQELYQQMVEIDRLDEEDRYVAKRVLQALLMKKQLETFLAQPSRRPSRLVETR